MNVCFSNSAAKVVQKHDVTKENYSEYCKITFNRLQ
mgnify:CR=1 FL=1